MEFIFRTHDDKRDAYVVNEHLKIGTLGYADDVVIASTNSAAMSGRITSVSEGSVADGDKHMNKKKTKTCTWRGR